MTVGSRRIYFANFGYRTLDFRRHLFHETPHRSACLSIGQAAQGEVSRQIRQVEPLANVLYLFAHFVGASDEHAALRDEIFERELLHLFPLTLMTAVGFRVSHPGRQAVRLTGRRVIYGKALGRVLTRLPGTFTY